MKIVVDQLPEIAKDCLFSRHDSKAIGFCVWHICKRSEGMCYVDYGDPCQYLIAESKGD